MMVPSSMRLLGAVVVSAATCGDLRADTVGSAFILGNQLYADCTSGATAPTNACQGYILGTLDAFLVDDHLHGGRRICPPKGATGSQFRDIVVKYLREHPETRHYSAASLIILASREAFSCKD